MRIGTIETPRLTLRPISPDDVQLLVDLDGDAEVMRYLTNGLPVAFAKLGARRVWAQTMAVNPRSRRVLERCGMRYVRTFHEHFDDPIPGTEQGEVEYEIRHGDWIAASGPS